MLNYIQTYSNHYDFYHLIQSLWNVIVLIDNIGLSVYNSSKQTITLLIILLLMDFAVYY